MACTVGTWDLRHSSKHKTYISTYSSVRARAPDFGRWQLVDMCAHPDLNCCCSMDWVIRSLAETWDTGERFDYPFRAFSTRCCWAFAHAIAFDGVGRRVRLCSIFDGDECDESKRKLHVNTFEFVALLVGYWLHRNREREVKNMRRRRRRKENTEKKTPAEWKMCTTRFGPRVQYVSGSHEWSSRTQQLNREYK